MFLIEKKKKKHNTCILERISTAHFSADDGVNRYFVVISKYHYEYRKNNYLKILSITVVGVRKYRYKARLNAM